MKRATKIIIASINRCSSEGKRGINRQRLCHLLARNWYEDGSH